MLTLSTSLRVTSVLIYLGALLRQTTVHLSLLVCIGCGTWTRYGICKLSPHFHCAFVGHNGPLKLSLDNLDLFTEAVTICPIAEPFYMIYYIWMTKLLVWQWCSLVRAYCQCSIPSPLLLTVLEGWQPAKTMDHVFYYPPYYGPHWHSCPRAGHVTHATANQSLIDPNLSWQFVPVDRW